MDNVPPASDADAASCNVPLAELFAGKVAEGPRDSYSHHLTQLMRCIVPSFADACTVDLLQGDGAIQRFAYFRNLQQTTYEPTGTLATQPASLHCIRVPLSDGIKGCGTIVFLREPRTRPFDADDVLDAKRLASRVFTGIEQCTHEASQSYETKQTSQASAILAHELRNPLSVIKTAVDLLSLDLNADRRMHAILSDQVKKMVRLVDDLSEMSRHQCGKAQLRIEPCHLQSLVAEVLQNMAAPLAARCQSIETTLAAQPIWLNADPLRISQILVNLISNASKYSEKASPIQLTVKVVDGFAEIRVIDQGVGISPEDLPHVFEFFAQSKNSIDHSDGGLGIGLGLVRSLTELHGGAVQAFSRGKDQGSEFVVRLPICPSSQPPLQPVAEPRKARSCKVLIVDDRPDTQYLLSALIKKVGPHETQSASNGQAALAAMQTFRPDAVLLDIGMPGMDGLEVAREIRKSPTFADVLLVAVTGYDGEEIRHQSLQAGFDIFQLKPASLEMIRAILRHPKLLAVSASLASTN